MKTRLTLLLLAALGGRAEILDRIAVSVGKQVITERDVLREVRVTAFLDHRQVEMTAEQKRAAADRLVEQVLILEEAAMTRVTLPSDEDARKMLEGVKAQYGGGYEAALLGDQITEPDVLNHLAAGLRAMRFTDLRFRPEVQISDEDLHDFYNSLVVSWKRSGETKIPTFEASRDEVERLLTDQRTAQALDRWLGTRRTETEILYREQVFQ